MKQFMKPFICLRDHHFYTSLLNQKAVVVDLGANVGQFSSQVSGMFGCHCYAVEAFPVNYDQIKENQLIHKFNYAITERNQPVEFHISKNPEGHSLYNLPNTNEGTITVQGITLEQFLIENKIQTIDLLKVDLEGAELKLFDSLNPSVLKNVKQITIEFHDFIKGFDCHEKVKNIMSMLKKHQFLCINFTSPIDNMDVLFVNKSCVSPLVLLNLFFFKHLRLPIRKFIAKIKK